MGKTCCGSGQRRAWCDSLTVKMLVAGILCRRWSFLASPLVHLFMVVRPVPCAGRACRFVAKINVSYLSQFPLTLGKKVLTALRTQKKPPLYYWCSTYTSVIISIIRIVVHKRWGFCRGNVFIKQAGSAREEENRQNFLGWKSPCQSSLESAKLAFQLCFTVWRWFTGVMWKNAIVSSISSLTGPGVRYLPVENSVLHKGWYR